ncbi:MAG TPA: branched-chain amino acid ABC transporter permease [Anaerolineales bacterium]|nr:branched-chain amino acid ABC transporter permease [Anaerolineales bacterium]
MTLDSFLQNFLNAMQLGSYLALIAVGYTMVYGVLLLINFAHGDIFMVGAYVGYFIGTFLLNRFDVQLPFDLPSWVVIPVTVILTMAITALVGVTLERVAYRPLRNRGAHRLYLVITALSAGLFLEYINLASLGARDRQFPELIKKQIYPLGGVSVTNIQIMVILVSFSVMGLLWFIVQRTRWGMAMRAISYDRLAVPLMGVSVDKVIVTTFVIGSSMAALAGVMYGTAYPILRFDMGLLVGWRAFIAAVVGGIGSIRGAMLGGYLMGFTQIFVTAFLPSTFRDLITFTVFLLILSVRPTGLFGVARRTKV